LKAQAESARATQAAAAAQAAAQRRERERAAELRAQQQEQELAQQQAERRARQATKITDADLQTVYNKFNRLSDAIVSGDIASVTSLTRRSPASRIQKLLQLFQNSQTITARVTKLAARQADAAISGTLEITGATGFNGAPIRVPVSLRYINLSSQRNNSGWSEIEW